MTAPSAIAAKHIAGLIHDLKILTPSERPQKIRNILADAMDLIELKGIRSRQEKLFFYVDVLGSVLFTYTFMILPWALYATLGAYIRSSDFGPSIMVDGYEKGVAVFRRCYGKLEVRPYVIYNAETITLYLDENRDGDVDDGGKISGDEVEDHPLDVADAPECPPVT